MRKIFIVFFMHCPCLLNMEKISAPQDTYAITTLDGTTDIIPQKHLNLCNAISSMLKDLPNNAAPLPLPVTSSILPLVKQCLRNSYITQDNNASNLLRTTAQKELAILLNSQANLHTILVFADKFEEPYLLNYCKQLWATTKYAPTKQYPLLSYINIDIAQRMNRSKLLIDNVAGWAVENFKKNKIKLHKKTLSLAPHALWTAAISKNGNFVAGGDCGGIITIYNCETEEYQYINSAHVSCCMLQFNNLDRQILSSGKSGIIKIWNLENGKYLAFFHAPTCRAFVFRYIPEYELLIADSIANNIASNLCVWNIADSKNLNPEIIKAHENDIITLESAHDGSLFATGSSDRTCHIWNTATKNRIATFAHNVAVMSTQFNYTKNELLCGLQNGTMFLYDLVTAQRLWHNREHSSGIWSVQFTDMNDILFCSGSKDKTIKLWDHRTYKSLETLQGHTDHIMSMAADHATKKLVSASMDKTIKIWDLRNLIKPIKTVRNEISNKCTIEDILMLKDADNSDTPLNMNNPYRKKLFEKFSPRAQQFLLDNENIAKSD